MARYISFVLLCFGLPSSFARAELPVSWNRALLPDLQSLDQLPAVMLYPLRTQFPLELSLRGKTIIAKACQDYLGLKAQGYSASGWINIRMEASFIQRCRTLEFLARARPSSETRLAHEWNDNSAKEIPVCFGELGGDSGFWALNNRRVLDGESLAGEPWRSMAARGAELTLTGEDEVRSIDLMAFGDVNGDGFEDALVYVRAFPTQQATWQLSETYEVTRTNARSGTLLILEQVGPTLNGAVYGCPRTFFP